MKTIYYNIAALLLLAAAAYAVTQGNIVTFQNNTNVVITTFCSQSNGDPCTSSQSCALTSYYPNLSFVAENKTMLFSKVGFFNTTLGVLNVTGDYPTFVNCTDGTINRTADATFRVVVTLNESAIYERNTNVTLRGLCINPNGNRCTSSESCALTAYNPDSTIRVNKSSMTFEADGFFTYLMGVLTIVGDYHSFMNCTDGTFNRSIDATFKVVLSVDQQFHTDINNTLSTLNKTVIDANSTLSTINKTVIDANTTLSTLNKTVIDANVTLGTINSSIINLNTTLLNESNYGNFSLRRISTEINNTKTLLKNLLDKQAELSSEEIFLITDSLVSINRLVEAMDNGNVTLAEASQKFQEIKRVTETVSAKAANPAKASAGSNSALYIIIIIASASMTLYILHQARHPRFSKPTITTIKVKPSDSISPKIQPKPLHDKPLLQFIGQWEPDGKKPTSIKDHIKELKKLYKEGVIDEITYKDTKRRFLENLELVKKKEQLRKIEVAKKSKPRLSAVVPWSSRTYAVIKDISNDEKKEFVDLGVLLNQPSSRIDKIKIYFGLFTKKGRIKRRVAKLHKALDDNYYALCNGIIDMPTYLEGREKLVEKLKETNFRLKDLR